MFSCLIPGLENVHLCTSSNDTLNSIISRLIIVKVLQINYYFIVYVVDYFFVSKMFTFVIYLYWGNVFNLCLQWQSQAQGRARCQTGECRQVFPFKVWALLSGGVSSVIAQPCSIKFECEELIEVFINSKDGRMQHYRRSASPGGLREERDGAQGQQKDIM